VKRPVVIPAQGVLFGRQSIHLGHPTCLMCKVLLAVSAAWAVLPDSVETPGTLERAA
jgi:hypothetical protein